MDNRELSRIISGLFIVGFQGTSLPEDVRRLIDMGLGGVILFSRNLPDVDTSVSLVEQLCAASSNHPLLVSLDQEGGPIQRLGPPVLQLPAMQVLGSGGPVLCRRAGAQLGAELNALGYCMDYAPVLDVNSNPANPVIGQRAFSEDPATAAQLALSFAQGLSEAGVANCGKHFPGHGDTDTDSHVSLPRLAHSMERMRSVELLPFTKAAHLDSIMVAHLLADSIDAGVPTSLSPATYEMLRHELGFDGLCLTDDVEMGAVAEDPGVVDAGVAAIAAGADGVLVCHRPELVLEAVEKIMALVSGGQMDLARLRESGKRWIRLKKKYGFDKQARMPDRDRFEALCKCPERKQLEEDIQALEQVS